MSKKDNALIYHQRIFGFLTLYIKEHRQNVLPFNHPTLKFTALLNNIGVEIVEALDLNYFLNCCRADFNYTSTPEGRNPKKIWYLFMDGNKYTEYMAFRNYEEGLKRVLVDERSKIKAQLDAQLDENIANVDF